MAEPSQPSSAAAEPGKGGGGAKRGGSALSDGVHNLTDKIRALEGQLDSDVANNDDLVKDLEDERVQRSALERRIRELEEELRHTEQDCLDKDGLLGEVSQLKQERATLANQAADLKDRVAALEPDERDRQRLIERLRAARAAAVEEVQSVEAQFDRAMEMVAEAKAQVTVLTEERDALLSQLRVTEERVRKSEAERDSLLDEVEQSRAALDEIRRSLVDACVVSSGALPGEAGSDKKPSRRR
jgi:chromosome segregation ATPase